jgi:hypothetical protein
MFIFKMISHLATALVAFGLSTIIVAGIQPTKLPITDRSDEKLPASKPEDSNLSGIYFVAPSNGDILSKDCMGLGQIRASGRDSFLETHQMPTTKRTMRDGRWFFLETETVDGTSYEFFGITSGDAGNTALGKLVKISNGSIRGNVDAVYYNPACSLK